MKHYTIEELKAHVCKQIDVGDFETDERGQMIFYTGLFAHETDDGSFVVGDVPEPDYPDFHGDEE